MLKAIYIILLSVFIINFIKCSNSEMGALPMSKAKNFYPIEVYHFFKFYKLYLSSVDEPDIYYFNKSEIEGIRIFHMYLMGNTGKSLIIKIEKTKDGKIKISRKNTFFDPECSTFRVQHEKDLDANCFSIIDKEEFWTDETEFMELKSLLAEIDFFNMYKLKQFSGFCDGHSFIIESFIDNEYNIISRNCPNENSDENKLMQFILKHQ